MRILVVGGTGFIGARVVAALANLGHDLAVVSRGRSAPPDLPDVRHITADRCRLSESAGPLRAFAPDVVLDVVLSSGSQARELVGVFRGVARRVVALSSLDVYRACGVLHGLEEGPLELVPLTEASPLRTKLQTYPPEQITLLKEVFGWLDDEYDKIPVERAILADEELPGTVLRLPMVYGPGDRLHRLFPLLKRMDDGRRAIILDERTAQWRGPRGFVENVAAAIALATTSERAAGGIYNVGEEENASELEWARHVARIAGWSGELVVLPPDRVPEHLRARGNLAQHWSVDTSRIRAELEYREPIARDEAIRRTIEWERANPPPQIDPRQFDYAAEDAAVRSVRLLGGP